MHSIMVTIGDHPYRAVLDPETLKGLVVPKEFNVRYAKTLLHKQGKVYTSIDEACEELLQDREARVLEYKLVKGLDQKR